jgi:hypothetical protein
MGVCIVDVTGYRADDQGPKASGGPSSLPGTNLTAEANPGPNITSGMLYSGLSTRRWAGDSFRRPYYGWGYVFRHERI